MSEISWVGYSIPTSEATWICTKCERKILPVTPDQIEYVMEFEASNPKVEGFPPFAEAVCALRPFELPRSPIFLGTSH